MKSYLVGGAVRDRLLGREPSEFDWVVVGATEKEMLALGYKRVGHDFPVFLHPQSGDQYALARQERKQGHGHRGFQFDTSATVSLEDDLLRRDLTINAIAQDSDGTLIDPHGGRADLEARILRHVSPAFVEDPLRVLRVARFAARFAPLGFTVAGETLALMREIVASGELEHLPAERVFQEIRLALVTEQPDVFLHVLRECGALAVVLPEIERLYGVPQPEKYHPEIDTGVHVGLALRIAAQLGMDDATRFAVLVHDLGKALTDPAKWPSHVMHEELGIPAIEQLCERVRAPAKWRELAVLVSRHHTRCHRALEMKAPALVRLLEDTDAFRQPERFEQFLQACEADARGRTGLEERDYSQTAHLRAVRVAAAAVNVADALAKGLQGEQIRTFLHEARCKAVRHYLEGSPLPPAGEGGRRPGEGS